jgi:hypothetical protein
MADSQVTTQASAQAAAQATQIVAQVASNKGGQRVLATNEFKVMGRFHKANPPSFVGDYDPVTRD